MAQTYNAQAQAAFQAAVDALGAARDAIGDARPLLTAHLEAGIRDLTSRRNLLAAALAMGTWSADRAQQALEAAQISATITDDRYPGAAVVTFDGQRAIILPAATKDIEHPTGYSVRVVTRAGADLISLRADDDVDLVDTIQRLIRQAT